MSQRENNYITSSPLKKQGKGERKMKYWRCKRCFREHESKDNVKIVFCSSCLIKMQRFPYAKKMEVKNGRGELSTNRNS